MINLLYVLGYFLYNKKRIYVIKPLHTVSSKPFSVYTRLDTCYLSLFTMYGTEYYTGNFVNVQEAKDHIKEVVKRYEDIGEL